MSEQEQERPLTRRELRLREQAASESNVSAPAAVADAEVAPAVAAEQSDISVEIDPLNEDGTPRTRREIRELRAAAIAAILAERGEAAAEEEAAEADREPPHRAHRPGGDHRTEAAEVAEAEAEAEAEVVEEAEVIADEAADIEEAAEAFEPAEGDDAAAIAEDVIDGAPTEAFTLADLLDASEPQAQTGDAEAIANLFADEEEAEAPAEVVSAGADSEDVVAEAEIETEREELEDLEADSVEEEPAQTAVLESVDVHTATEISTEDADADSAAVVDNAAADVAAEIVEAAAAADATDAADAEEDSELPAPVAAPTQVDDEKSKGTETAGYSFPDIQPPEEWQSVFDDPSRAATIGGSGSAGSSDFDDLITRAVAQEGSTGATGTAALILPTHPAETGGLSGPLGATGELFVTGSIELPKSLGETGGHAALHDSVEFDAFLTGDQSAALPAADESGPMPVSALSAVSARRRPEVPVVAEPAKERSKLPLVLALSGGGLIVVLAGAVIYAASQGVFG